MESNFPKPAVSEAPNDHVYNVLWGVAAVEGSFSCECTESSCGASVTMTPAEYVRLRDRGELIFAPGHHGAIA